MTWGAENWHTDNTVLTDIKERTNIEIEFLCFPESAIREKYQTLTATGDLPDMMMGLCQDNITMDTFAKSGVIEPLSDHFDIMPNFEKAIVDNPIVEGLIKASDGKVYQAFGDGYYAPFGVSTALVYVPVWLEDMGVAFKADTWEDVYQMAKGLKAAKPEAYPFLTRSSFGALIYRMAPSFGTDQKLFYDPTADTFAFGPTLPGYETMIAFINKLYMEELLHPEAATMDSQSYYNIILNEAHEYQGGAFLFEATSWKGTGFNVGTAEEPFYPFDIMLPPAGTSDGVRQLPSGTKYKVFGTNGFYVNSQAQDMEAVLKWLDYTYSEDGIMFLSWGKEGIHYEMTTVDGVETPISIQYKDKPFDLNDIYTTYVHNTMFGWNYGFYGLNTVLPKYNQQYPYLPQDKVDAQQMMLDADAVKWPNPSVWFSELESPYITTKTEQLNTYVTGEVAKFIMNQRPMTDWDVFQGELKAMGVEQFIEMYNTAYQRGK